MRHDYTPANNPLRGVLYALAVSVVWWAAVSATLYAVLSH